MSVVRIELVIEGIDLQDESVDEAIGTHFGGLGWGVRDGRTTSTIYAEDSADPVCVATETAHRLENLILGAKAIRVHEDLVSISDIAARVGVTREAVRLWAGGERGPGGFPFPRDSVGGGVRNATRVWAWADVLEWLASSYLYETDELFPSREQIAEINAHLAHVERDIDHVWQATSKAPMGPLLLTVHVEPMAANRVESPKWRHADTENQRGRPVAARYEVLK